MGPSSSSLIGACRPYGRRRDLAKYGARFEGRLSTRDYSPRLPSVGSAAAPTTRASEVIFSSSTSSASTSRGRTSRKRFSPEKRSTTCSTNWAKRLSAVRRASSFAVPSMDGVCANHTRTQTPKASDRSSRSRWVRASARLSRFKSRRMSVLSLVPSRYCRSAASTTELEGIPVAAQ